MQQEAHKQASDAKERRTGERKETERWKKQPGLKPEPKTSEYVKKQGVWWCLHHSNMYVDGRWASSMT
jgi:hypothetical protein